MDTYLVTLFDRESGADQRILVQAHNPDGMQEFVDSDAVRPLLNLAQPTVVSIVKLRVKRPHRTVLASLEKTLS